MHALAAARRGAAESPSYAAYSQGRYLTALKLAEQEAAQGSKEAYTLMGEIYSEGLGVAQDFSKAADAYAKAADLGDANAQFSLGHIGRRRPRRDEGPAQRRRSVRASGRRTAIRRRNIISPSSISTAKGVPPTKPRPPSGWRRRPTAAIRRPQYDLGALLPIRPRRARRQGQGRGVDRQGRRGGLARSPSRIRRHAVQRRRRRRRTRSAPPSCSGSPPSRAIRSPRTGLRASMPMAWR